MRKLPPVLITSTTVALTAAAGTIGVDVTSRWYQRLDKPAWQPPGPVFGVAWTALYILIAGAGARALARAEQDADPVPRRRYLTAYAINLALNAGWTWTFFRARKPWLAVAEVAVLEISTLELTRRTGRLDRRAGAALVPYAVWTSYATALSAEIARRNRRSPAS
jgi:benzodiazapine receptor